MHGIVLFAHGARDSDWSRPFEAIRDRIRTKRPECPIALAYFDFLTPTLGEAVDALVEEGALAITVFPVFMSRAGHVKNDLPKLLEAIRAAHPHVPIALESAAGEVPEVLDAVAGWVLARVD
jgi:sirohydrochlorin cobaltochelatase